MIEKKKIYIPYKRVIKPAHYQDIDTGNFKEITIIDENGVEKKEKTPIFNRVFIDAVIEDALEEKEVFVVNIDGEEHLFNNKKDAEDFLK